MEKFTVIFTITLFEGSYRHNKVCYSHITAESSLDEHLESACDALGINYGEVIYVFKGHCEVPEF